jgi:hypothetical protein
MPGKVGEKEMLDLTISNLIHNLHLDGGWNKLKQKNIQAKQTT